MAKLLGKQIGDLPGMVKDIGIPASSSYPTPTIATPGYFLADGSVVSQALYVNLWNAIGTLYNTGGEGAGNFRLPNYSRAVAVGSGGSATGELGNTTGSVGGEESHSLSTSELSPHTHNISSLSGNTGSENSAHSHSDSFQQFAYIPPSSGGGQQWAPSGLSNTGFLQTSNYVTAGNSNGHAHSFSGVSGSTDSGSGLSGANHNNIQPSLVVTKLIKF